MSLVYLLEILNKKRDLFVGYLFFQHHTFHYHYYLCNLWNVGVISLNEQDTGPIHNNSDGHNDILGFNDYKNLFVLALNVHVQFSDMQYLYILFLIAIAKRA